MLQEGADQSRVFPFFEASELTIHGDVYVADRDAVYSLIRRNPTIADNANSQSVGYGFAKCIAVIDLDTLHGFNAFSSARPLENLSRMGTAFSNDHSLPVEILQPDRTTVRPLVVSVHE